MQIIASIIAASQVAQGEEHLLDIADVILYCLHSTPDVVSQSSMQVLFDLTSSPRGTFTRSAPSSKIPERIRRVEYLMLSVHVAVASPKRVQLANSTLEWLIELCDESIDNISKILKHFELTPFLIILSLWSTCRGIQVIEKSPCSYNDGEVDFVIPPKPSPSHEKGTKVVISTENCSKETDSTILYYSKLQNTAARFMKLIVTGSLGELPSVPIPLSLFTPTGFSVSHMTSLLYFIHNATRLSYYCYSLIPISYNALWV